MSGHSPEPWKYSTDMDGRVNIFVDDGRVVTLCHAHLRPEDARRIVACVNACDGLTTEFLETPDLAFSPARAAAKMAEIERQRDQLLEAIQYAVSQVPELGMVPGVAAAIAAVDGNSHG